MCLLIVVSRVLPQWTLVVAANRDERDRPASAVHLPRPASPRTLEGGIFSQVALGWLSIIRRGGRPYEPSDFPPDRQPNEDVDRDDRFEG